ncbi:MAG: right-handed parallel beta-helix repeat-containing protein [Thermoanaerobaculia bacterium]
MSSALRVCKVVVLLAAVAAAATPAFAFDFIVTRYNDPVPDGCLADDCSLREAVIAANAASDSDRILLSAGVYTITLVGSGEDFAATGDLDLKNDVEILGIGAGITILDAAGLGEQPLAASVNGRVFAIRKLTVRNSDTSGLFLGSGTQTVEDCEIRDNGSTGAHHGIVSVIGSVATLRRVSLVGNAGSGLSATQSSITAENSTFSGNGTFDVSVSTMVAFSCTHCTLYDPTDSDPEFKAINSPTLTIANSIVAGNCNLTNSTLTSLGGNVESAANTCGFGQPTDLNGVTSVALDLAALATNGGETRTHLPGAASVAVGNSLDALCLPTDQRGVARTTDCESGSVELTAAAVATPIFFDGFLQGDTEAWSATVP